MTVVHIQLSTKARYSLKGAAATAWRMTVILLVFRPPILLRLLDEPVEPLREQAALGGREGGRRLG